MGNPEDRVKISDIDANPYFRDFNSVNFIFARGSKTKSKESHYIDEEIYKKDFFVDDICEPVVCPKGHKCPKDSAKPSKCLAGQFTDQPLQIKCYQCPRGYYCPCQAMFSPIPCDQG